MFENNHDTLVENIASELLWYMPAYVAHYFWYCRNHKCKPNFKNPQTYDERIHWLMMNVYKKDYARYADKYLVREYVKAAGLENILIPLHGVYDSVEEINFEKLPQKFILKVTHGSGDRFYVICKDKANLDWEKEKKKLQRALKTNFAKTFCEYQYAGIKPRIICEELLQDEKSDRLTDYKVVCVNGKAKQILVCSDRNEGRDYYDTEWNYLDYVVEKYRSGSENKKPNNLQEMLYAAEKLAAPFPLARIDFYNLGDKLYFGEVTLTPSAGSHLNLNELGQYNLGKGVRLNRKA